jgi:hypothetical protein
MVISNPHLAEFLKEDIVEAIRTGNYEKILRQRYETIHARLYPPPPPAPPVEFKPEPKPKPAPKIEPPSLPSPPRPQLKVRLGIEPGNRRILRALTQAANLAFDISMDVLRSTRREHDVVIARMIIMHLARLRGVPMARISEYFSRNHATVLHATRAIPKRLLFDRDLKNKVDALLSHLDESGETVQCRVPTDEPPVEPKATDGEDRCIDEEAPQTPIPPD